ncbi:MAG: NAD(P)-dependent oxidoreductase [Patescibacteria group bacterium]
MKILITGATGLLGTELARHFTEEGHNVASLTSSECDVTLPESITLALKLHKPNTIINCAVIIDVDKCETDSQTCYSVNRDGVKNLLDGCLLLGLKPIFVQISSSETFGRVKKGEYNSNGYKEDDLQIPASVYQKSKKEAEDILLSFTKKHPDALRAFYIPRAGWLYGGGRETFVDRFISALRAGKPIMVIKEQWRSPTWTRDFAQGLSRLIADEYPSGIYHIVDEVKPGEATAMDVVEELKRYLGASVKDIPMTFTTHEEFFKAPRAPSNVLLNTKLPKLRYWRDSLREYLTERYPLR